MCDMHQPPIAVHATCERCNCRFKVAQNKRRRVSYCPDCLAMFEAEKNRERQKWVAGTYHMIYDPDETWSPCGGWFTEKEILRDVIWFTPGTRFESKGRLYEITAKYKLERIAPN